MQTEEIDDPAIKGKKKGWELLLADLPPKALKTLDERIYRKKGLTDVNEAYLWQRLHNSGFPFSVDVISSTYHGQQTRKGYKGDYQVHLGTAVVRLTIVDDSGPRVFSAGGASENMSFDAAIKGANTSGFKQACKAAGMTQSLYKGGSMVDEISVVEQEDYEGGRAPAGDRTPPPAGDEKPPISKPLQQTLVYMLSTLPTYAKAAADGVPEAERPWNLARVGTGVRSNEVRKAGTGFMAVFKVLTREHEKECGADCEHLKTALASEGYAEAVRPQVVA